MDRLAPVAAAKVAGSRNRRRRVRYSCIREPRIRLAALRTSVAHAHCPVRSTGLAQPARGFVDGHRRDPGATVEAAIYVSASGVARAARPPLRIDAAPPRVSRIV